jgi:hypothetical protein
MKTSALTSRRSLTVNNEIGVLPGWGHLLEELKEFFNWVKQFPCLKMFLDMSIYLFGDAFLSPFEVFSMHVQEKHW